MAGLVGQQGSFDVSYFFVFVFVLRVDPEDLEQLPVISHHQRTIQVPHLLKRFGENFQLQRIIRRMLNQGVTGLELERTGVLANPKDGSSVESAPILS